MLCADMMIPMKGYDRPTSLTVLIEASHKCGRMRRESRPQSPACLMYLAWTHKFRDNILYRSFNN